MKHKWKKKKTFNRIMDVSQQYCEVCGKTRMRSMRKRHVPSDDEECPGKNNDSSNS